LIEAPKNDPDFAH
jgi:hypothetical protein